MISGKLVTNLPVWNYEEFMNSKNMDYTYGSPKDWWVYFSNFRERDDD